MNKNSLFSLKEDFFQPESSFDDAFNQALAFVLSKKELGANIYKSPFINDEPKCFSYSVDLSNLNKSKKKEEDDDEVGSGTALTPKKALMKALGESIERYCLSICNYADLITASQENIRKKAIDIFKFSNFSPDQLKDKNFKIYRFNGKSKIRWINGYSLKDNKEVLIPAQLIYVPYKFDKEEPVIRDPITTGAAASTSLGGAIYRGICEIIERDSFMIFYLNNLSGETIDLVHTSSKLKKMRNICKRYHLDLKVVDITTDLGIPSMMGIIIDKTGLGPAISIGLSSDLDPVIAAISAAEEAFHGRPWIRSEMIKQNPNRNVNSQVGRGLYWSNPEMLKKCEFLFNNEKKKILKQKYKEKYIPEKLKKILFTLLQKFDYDVYYSEVTTPEIIDSSFRVVKVIIPNLHPLFLDEDFPYLWGKRLFEVPKILGYKKNNEVILNKIPHPFL